MTIVDFIQVAKVVKDAHAKALANGADEKQTLLARADAVANIILTIKHQLLCLMHPQGFIVYQSTIDDLMECLIRAEYAHSKYLNLAEVL